ncbi:Aldehyde dehydrogenase family 3 member H1 [Candida viswanathii]|uniref:Aldehyde dehydrogenase family 3 member H1 n=1 Tax=Candida viswanathii TaxID=5486 RepID=A0A367YIC1_9ASCO|nr:Aldehyde dehydrogenase family 3 member H1 [Candida viswanathii]
MKNILDKTTGKIIIGGKMDSASRYVSPTVIDDATWDDSSMQEEIFGPILPVLTYTDLTQACRDYNSQINTIATIIRSGGLVINDVLMHIALHNAPFGGIGKSGHGAYHGEFSYRAFTHERTVLEQNLWNDGSLSQDTHHIPIRRIDWLLVHKASMVEEFGSDVKVMSRLTDHPLLLGMDQCPWCSWYCGDFIGASL